MQHSRENKQKHQKPSFHITLQTLMYYLSVLCTVLSVTDAAGREGSISPHFFMTRAHHVIL